MDRLTTVGKRAPERALPGSAPGRRRSAGAALRRLGEPALLACATVTLLVAVAWRAADAASGVDLGTALTAVGAQLPVTLPAAALVSLAMALNIAAGAGLLRLLRRAPFESWADVVLAGVAGAVVLDVSLLSLLGGLGWFRAAPLAVALAAVAFAGAARRPYCTQRLRIGRIRPSQALLVTAAWASILTLSLASPVVPAADVLPNHVAPAEHLRAFGAIATLATYPSPLYGPSRLFLGYEGLFGTLTVLTGLSAALAVSVSSGWLVVVTALAARRLAGRAFGRGAAYWALLALLPTFTFVRLVDVRDSVTALPLAAVALAGLVGSRAGRGRGRPDGRRPDDDRPDWALATALTAATLLHPLVGALTGTAVALAAFADPARLLRRAVPALMATAVALAPQVAVMTGLEPAPITALVALAAGAVVAAAASRALSRVGIERLAVDRAARRRGITAVALGAIAGLLALLAVRPASVGQAAGWVNLAFPLPFAAAALALAGLVPASHGGRRLVASGLAAGVALLLAAALVPAETILGQSIRYEVPKAVGYWLPWVCVPALAGLLAAVARRARRRQAGWLVVAAGVLALALLPSGPVAPNSAQASHPSADVAVWNLRTAALGYWQGYPDPRSLVGARGTAVDAFLEDEIAAGRLRAGDRLLHVAASYQAWASIPVAAFVGVDETVVSGDASTTIFTAGGRVHPLSALASQLRDGFGWVLLESDGLPGATRDAIVAAGYRSVFTTAGAEVYAAEPTAATPPAVEGDAR